MVHLDAQGLVYFRQKLVFGRPRKDRRYRFVQVTCGVYLFPASESAHETGYFPAVFHFSVNPEYPFQVFLLISVQYVGCRCFSSGIHPHVQRGVKPEREPPAGSVELM